MVSILEVDKIGNKFKFVSRSATWGNIIIHLKHNKTN